jgi:protein O-mannosyl-transferase
MSGGSETAGSWKKRSCLFLIECLAIAAAGLFALWPAVHGQWLWDDPEEITNNPLLHGWSGLAKLWFASSDLDYFPLKSTIQWIGWHIWGDNPTSFHLLNVSLHVIAALLFWRLLAKLGVRHGWLGGLIFVVHPLAIESVAWISELKNPLSLVFLLLAMCAYVDFDGYPAKSGSHYFRALAWYVAAMLSKSSVVMLPVVLLLYAWWRRGKVNGADLKASLPFFLVSLVLGLVTVWFQSHRGIGTVDIPMNGVGSRLTSAGLAVLFYLSKCVLPVELMPIYPRLPEDPRLALDFLPGFLTIVLLGLLHAVRPAWRRPILFCLGSFLINLLPILGLVRMSYLRVSGVANHFAYLPMLSILGLATGGLSELVGRGTVLGGLSRLRDALYSTGFVLVAVVLAFGSRPYAKIFRSAEAYWTYALIQNPASCRAADNLGVALDDEGRIDEAIAKFRVAVQLDPQFFGAHFHLGVALAGTGREVEAIDQYELAIQLRPQFAEASYMLANSLFAVGKVQEAIVRYRQALEIKPDFPQAHNNLGVALAKRGLLSEAIVEYRSAARLRPNDALSCLNLGVALATAREDAEAVDQFRRALDLDPKLADAQFCWGLVLERAGDLQGAAAHYARALELRPGYSGARAGLDRVRGKR